MKRKLDQKKHQLSILLLLSLLFTASGCGDGPSDDPKSGTGNGAGSGSNSGTGIVELGPVTGSDVSIETLDAATNLYTATTDDDGKYTIDKATLKAAANNLMPVPEYVRIVATGGTDLDPDDDGTQDAAESLDVGGEVLGIVSMDDLDNATDNDGEEIRINLITTAIAELVKDTDENEINKELLDHLAEEIGVEDVDGDKQVTYKVSSQNFSVTPSHEMRETA